MSDEGCLFRTPYGSILSCLLIFVGMAVFSAFLSLGVEDLEYMLHEKFTSERIDIRWAQSIRYAFIITAVIMAIYGFILVAFGYLATGATRKSVYTGPKCIMGGKCSALFFLLVTYFFNAIWLAVSSAMTVPIIIFLMLKSICDTELVGSDVTNKVCLNITRFGIYFPNFTIPVINPALQAPPVDPYGYRHGPVVCDALGLSEVCTRITNGATFYYPIAFAGSALIVLGLSSFLIVISVNYQRIKTAKEVTDYRDAVEQETELESVYLSQSRRNFQSSQNFLQSQSYINGGSTGEI